MKKFVELVRYSPYNVTGMKYHLEKMAQKGWMIHHITNNYWSYRKTEPKDCRFAVSYFAKASAYDPQKSEGQETFEEMAAHDGWKLIAENAKLQIYTNEDKDATPIYTDAESEVKAILRSTRAFIITTFFLIAIVLLNAHSLYRRIQRDPLEVLADSTLHCITIGLTILLIYMLSQVIRYFIWKHKALRAVENDEFIETAKSDFSLQNWIIVLSFGISLCGGLASGNMRRAVTMLATFLGIFCIYFIVDAVRKLLQRNKVERKVNLFFTILADIVLALILTAGISWFMLDADYSDNSGQIMITTADLVEGESDQMFAEVKESPWLLYNKGFTAMMEKEYFHYSMIEVKEENLEDFALEQLLRGKDYRESDPSLFQADQTWQLWEGDKKQEAYLIRYDNRLVEVDFSWPVDEEDARKIDEAFDRQ